MMTTDKKAELTRITAREGGASLVFSITVTEGDEARRETLVAFASRIGTLPRLGALTDEELATLLFEDAYTKALKTGLRLLGSASLSKAQLMQKLCSRGIKREMAASVAEELWGRGYGNECDGALSVARRDLLKLWGDRRILLDVRAKGYDGEAIEAVRALLDDENSIARLERLISKKYRKDVAEGERERLVAALVRYGYTPREIKAALRDE
ncbi:MAG: RecX family transcriptional regulator [Clostridia bacterium]|nr:RecX family transcriptional regulator [Clostridia bacterium]